MTIVLPMYGNVGHENMWNSIGNRMVGFIPKCVRKSLAVVTYYILVLETHLLTITPTGPEQKD